MLSLRALLLPCLLPFFLAPPAAAQVPDDSIREYDERDLEAGGGLERPDLPKAPRDGVSPGLTVPGVIDGARAQEMTLEILDTWEWILTHYDMPSATGRAQVGTLQQARGALLMAAPEEMDSYAGNMGPHLARLYQAVRLQRHSLMNRGEESADGYGPVFAKSAADFPSPPPGLPAYPGFDPPTGSYDTSEESLEEDADALEDEAADRSGASGTGDALFCTIGTTAGRADRKSAEYIFEQRDILLAADIIWEIANNICGGTTFSFVFSGGYSCDLCCIINDVLHSLSVYFYDQIMICEDLIDSAEIEAGFHYGVKTFDGVKVVHDHLGTSSSITVKDEIDQNEALLRTVDDKADIIIDQTACRPVPALVRQSGCNGNDDDCDKNVDNCAEDVFGPTLHVDEAVAGPWYATLAEAAAAVQRATFAEDDCHSLTLAFAPLAGSCGSVSATVTATDACGNVTEVTQIVKVDGAPPTVSIDPSVEGSCHASIAAAEAAVLAAATITDNCDAALDVRLDSTVTECALRVRIEAIDAAGLRSIDAVTVRVDDRAPGLEIERLLLGVPAPCFTSVAEAEAAVAGIVSVNDNCSATAALSVSISSAGDPCDLLVTANTIDECGAPASDDLSLTVDPNPPVVTCNTTITEIDSSNHEMINVGFSYSAIDDCSANPIVTVRVTSDEATASASGAGGTTHAPDAQILRDLAGNVLGVLLRAERSTPGNGRVYQITVEAMDRCGNVATSSCQVGVAPNGSGSPVDDGQYYDATAVN